MTLFLSFSRSADSQTDPRDDEMKFSLPWERVCVFRKLSENSQSWHVEAIQTSSRISQTGSRISEASSRISGSELVTNAPSISSRLTENFPGSEIRSNRRFLSPGFIRGWRSTSAVLKDGYRLSEKLSLVSWSVKKMAWEIEQRLKFLVS